MGAQFDKKGTCEKVIGPIDRAYWCKLYSKTES